MEVEKLKPQGELRYLATASRALYLKMLDALSEFGSSVKFAREPDLPLAWFGTQALKGFVYSFRCEDGLDLDLAKFIPVTSKSITHSEYPNPQIDISALVQQQLHDLGIILPTPKLKRPNPNALIIYHHSLTTLIYLSARGRVALHDFFPAIQKAGSSSTRNLTTDWNRPFTKEAVWEMLKSLDHTIRLVILTPEIMNTRTDYYRAYEAACFFAASTHLLANPHLGKSYKEIAQQTMEKLRGKSK